MRSADAGFTAGDEKLSARATPGFFTLVNTSYGMECRHRPHRYATGVEYVITYTQVIGGCQKRIPPRMGMILLDTPAAVPVVF